MTNTQTKLQVTAEQKTALDLYTDSHGTTLFNFENYRTTWTNVYKPIKDLSLDDMAKALYVGYEVPAPKFEVGDWVTPINPDNLLSTYTGARVAKIEKSGNYLELENVGGIFTRDYVRHATPNEVFWAKMGRKENEVRVGDIIVDDDGSLYRVVASGAFIDEISVEDAVELSEAGEIYTIYPAESAVEFPK